MQSAQVLCLRAGVSVNKEILLPDPSFMTSREFKVQNDATRFFTRETRSSEKLVMITRQSKQILN